jgi:hypothetical protein
MSEKKEALRKINQFLKDLKVEKQEIGSFDESDERANHTALILAGLADVVEVISNLQETSDEILKALQLSNKIEELKIINDN